MKIIERASTMISAAAALLAFIFTIYVYVQTRKVLSPTERPIISLYEQKSQGEFIDNPPRVKTSLTFLFKNIGKNPAKNLRLRIGVSPKKNPEIFRHIIDVTVANRIDVDGVFNWNQLLEQILKLKGKVALIDEIELYIYLLLTYEDAFRPGKNYYDEFWLSYITGRAAAGHATVQEKLTLEPYVKAIYGERK